MDAKNAERAERRARGAIRRYCRANGLGYLWGLTYAVGCHDRARMVADVTAFMEALQERCGKMALLIVPEFHPGGHGYHLHMAVGRFIHWQDINACWPHGKTLTPQLQRRKPRGRKAFGDPDDCAGYLSKYISKSLSQDDEADPQSDAAGRESGGHRYFLTEGFQEDPVIFTAPTLAELEAAMASYMGREPDYVWSSDDDPEWDGPPARWYDFKRGSRFRRKGGQDGAGRSVCQAVHPRDEVGDACAVAGD